MNRTEQPDPLSTFMPGWRCSMGVLAAFVVFAFPPICYLLSSIGPSAEHTGGDGFQGLDRIIFWFVFNVVSFLGTLIVGGVAVAKRRCSKRVFFVALGFNVVAVAWIVAIAWRM